MLPNNRDQLERTKFIEDDDAKVAVRTVFGKGGATIYAVVNTAAAGVQESMVTLFPGPNQIGSVTVSNPVQLATGANYIGLASVNVGNTVNALLQAGSNYIGLASVNVGGSLPALSTGANWIGLATVAIGAQNTVSASFSGNVTLNPSPNFIGLATVVHASNVTLNASNAYIGLTSVNIGGTLPALSTGANFIGLATVVPSSNVTLNASNAYIGLASVNIGGSLPALSTGANYIGLATVLVGSALPAGTNTIGMVRLVDDGAEEIQIIGDSDGLGAGNMLITNSRPVVFNGTNYDKLRSANAANATTGIGVSAAGILGFDGTNYRRIITGTDGRIQSTATIAGGSVGISTGANYIGLASVNIGGTLPALSVGANYVGLASVNVGGSLPALSTGANYIGLATVIPAYISTYTSFATIASAIGNVTIFTPPSNQRFVIKDLLVGALGRNEVAFLSGATILIPLVGLATTGGYIGEFGDNGLRGKALNDALVMNLNSAATVSVMVNVRFE